ncbi:MAG: AmmeMemoRadiSam system protein A [Patescibacteria group bacterium]|nr:AmmeMemoRadiSam system protein A [Patescibacteria group bacterium]
MNPYILLAKQAVENFIKEGKIIEPPRDLPEEFLNKRAGTFVTIEKDGELRGCIGTYLPTRVNIAEEIIRNAIAAATEDYRFEPIKIDELPKLSYTVYILSYPEPVKDLKELDPKKFGIIVKTGPLTYPNQDNVVFDGVVPYKTGLLLPDLDGVDTVEKQIAIACQKGGIDPQREKIFIYKFTVEKF